jgi:hypothetical protein
VSITRFDHCMHVIYKLNKFHLLPIQCLPQSMALSRITSHILDHALAEPVLPKSGQSGNTRTYLTL